MGRRAKPAKRKRASRGPATRGSATGPASARRDLEKRLAKSRAREKATGEILKQTARALTEALAQQTATSKILGVISTSPTDVQPVFDAIAESAVRLLHGFSVIVWRYDGERLDPTSIRGGLPGSDEDARRILPSLARARGTYPWDAIIERAVEQIADVEQEAVDPLVRATARARGWRANLAVPMLREGQPIGLITVSRAEPGRFSRQDITLLQTFADQAVIAIENVRLFTELQEKNRALAEAHARVTEALAQQTAMGRVLEVISSSPTDVRPVMEVVVESAARLCEAQNAQIFQVEGETMRLVSRCGPVKSSLEVGEARAITRGSVSGRTIRDRRILHIPDLLAEVAAEYRDIAPAIRREGIRTTVGVPLLREGVPIGAVTAFRTEVRPFSDGQIALLQTFADQAAIAIENVRLFKELEARNRDLTEALEQQTATSEILRVISRSPNDVRPAFDTIAESAARLTGAAVATLYEYDGRLVHLRALSPATHIHADRFRSLFPRPLAPDFAAGLVLLERAALHVADLLNDPATPPASRQWAEWLEMRGILWVPLLRDEKAVGVIGVTRAEPGRFSDHQVKLLETFADQAVIAIENVRLFGELETRTQELTRSVGELRALGEVGQALGSTLDLDTVLTTIVQRAVELAGADGGSIFEYDEGAEEFQPRVSSEVEDVVTAIQQAPLRKGEGAVGHMAMTRDAVQIPDIAVEGTYESRARGALLRSGRRALLAVPLLSEERIVGGLVISRNAAGVFPAEVVALLKTFSTQSALAIRNARLFREIEVKSRELEVASQHKSEFLASMSHELRTPLNAIIGFSDVLLQRMFGETNEKQTEYLRDILASGQHLLSLINDILDLSKIEAGRMELDVAAFDLPTAIDDAMLLMRERAGRRGITLERHVDGRSAEIRADARKVKQVLLNLLSNAVKFTREGGRIDVTARMVDGQAEISVKDTGVGIAPEDREAVFEEFRQVGKGDRKAEGTGLGLALCRKFVELHGGRIWVESQVGVGSTFTFTLPRDR